MFVRWEVESIEHSEFSQCVSVAKLLVLNVCMVLHWENIIQSFWAFLISYLWRIGSLVLCCSSVWKMYKWSSSRSFKRHTRKELCLFSPYYIYIYIIFNNLFITFILCYEVIVCMCVNALPSCNVCACQKRASDALKLELWTVVSHQVGAGNGTQASQWSYPLNHLSSPVYNHF